MKKNKKTKNKNIRNNNYTFGLTLRTVNNTFYPGRECKLNLECRGEFSRFPELENIRRKYTVNKNTVKIKINKIFQILNI